MKKSKIIKIIGKSAGTYNLCRCWYNYDPNYWYFYIADNSDDLFMGFKEDDFILDGIRISRMKDLDRVEIKTDLCDEINRKNRILNGLNVPEIDLSSWRSVFKSLKKLGHFVIIQNEYNEKDGFYYLGNITKVKKDHIIFSFVDADGDRYDDLKISYSDISSVTFGDRYSVTWEKFLSENK